ncbi:uncharacterized protein I303_103787 [Kwoniella dejecticola CBS 10117]|uniref:Uncharacterized protein n=1 Tax=Kwoniella dejecticola CBS 10117 TaxID=1296121 RepID=A0A1A6A7Q7_9TREE|nr:uncharacterized protein I303_03805 [Kwoniella dejecticola CBS 10117]OBR86087.1 hypothetical protein I303_03805 [Kwoniella dejecticola CBS 10117]
MSVDIPAPHVPGSSAVAQPSVPSTSTSAAAAASAPPAEVPGAPVLGGEVLPKPVTPAEAITAEPAKALDPIAEPTILDKAQALAKPYLEKVEPYVHKAQEATKPYTDKIEAKTKEIIDKIEGNAPSTTAAPTSNNTAERTLDNASTTTSEASEKAKGIFEQGLSAVQSTFTQITHTIDEKTASPTHPGFITQVTNAAQKVGEKIEKAMNDVDNNTTPSAHPVQTTTNTVPHIPPVPL